MCSAHEYHCGVACGFPSCTWHSFEDSFQKNSKAVFAGWLLCCSLCLAEPQLAPPPTEENAVGYSFWSPRECSFAAFPFYDFCSVGCCAPHVCHHKRYHMLLSFSIRSGFRIFPTVLQRMISRERPELPVKVGKGMKATFISNL